jgi:hypothetical protein
MNPPPAAEASASKKQQKEAGKCENKERNENLRHKIELTPFEHQSWQLQSKMPCQKIPSRCRRLHRCRQG